MWRIAQNAVAKCVEAPLEVDESAAIERTTNCFRRPAMSASHTVTRRVSTMLATL